MAMGRLLVCDGRSYGGAEMTSQLSLLDYRPYKGNAPSVSHSETSKAAANGIEKAVGPLQAKVLAFLEANPEGATDEEMVRLIPMAANTLRPRRRELQLAGKIKDSGRVSLTASRRSAVVWVKA